MIIFPLIYLSSFFFTVKEFLKGNKETIFLFLIFGLSIYTTSISVIVKLGLNNYVGFFQSFKEIIIISLLGWCLYTYKEIIKLERVDYLILIFFLYTTTYALLPIGEQSLLNRLFAFKSVSFFAIIYFAGRFLNLDNLFLNKYFFFKGKAKLISNETFFYYRYTQFAKYKNKEKIDVHTNANSSLPRLITGS